MKNNETSIDEKFYKQLFWLENWFLKEKKNILPLVDKEQEMIFDELSNNWKNGNIISLLDKLAKKFGKKKVIVIIEMVVAENIRREWSEIARSEKSNTVDDLVRILLEPLQNGHDFEFTLEKKDNGIQMHCTKCTHVDLAKELNNTEWLYHLICSGDLYIVEGFNPKMGFQRTKTLMEGYECCNHFYFMKT